MTTRRRRPAGFSQVELAIAVVVLAVGILGVFAAFAYGVESTREGGRVSEATGWARQLVEIIRSENLPFRMTLPPPRSSGLNDPEGLDFKDMLDLNAAPFQDRFPADTGFKRSIQLRPLSTDPNNYRSKIAEISVTISWTENDRLRQVSFKALHRQP